MLVLLRAVGEEICIGDNICIRVVGIRGGDVKIGSVAPDVTVDRQEIHEKRLSAPPKKDAATNLAVEM